MINKTYTIKSKTIDKIRNCYNVYFTNIYYELITILVTYCTHKLTYTHISNQFIQFVGTLLGGFPAQFQEIKENYQNLTIKNSMEQMFL